jgi:hypothetical protein
MYQYFPQQAKKNFSSRGKDILQEIGIDIVKGVILDVLTGKNLRDSTELLTRKRILTINAATIAMMINGALSEKDFIATLPLKASERLMSGGIKKDEKWLLQWVLGLTDKGMQNILRDEKDGLVSYTKNYIDITKKAIEEFERDYGKIQGGLRLNSEQKALLNWEFMVQLMTIIGSQTLAIRGSDKSKFGKLFEKLILGTLLKILGFRMVSPQNITETNKVFWLSERETKRESDATLLYEKGRGIRFDIGFIGRGNTEISLDKVSRFEREIELGRQTYYMATLIIVDRIGPGSRIEELAKLINGNIVQMSGAYWPIKVAEFLKETLGYQDKILEQNSTTIDGYLKEKMKDIGIEELFNIPDLSQPVNLSFET